MILNVPLATSAFEETSNTLDYADRAKNIKKPNHIKLYLSYKKSQVRGCRA